MKTLILGAIVAAGVAFHPASASADGRVGVKSDRAGDSNAAAYDITKAWVGYDGKGKVRVRVTLSALPDAAGPAGVIVTFGRRAGGKCALTRETGAAINAVVPDGDRWLVANGGKLDTPTVSISGTTVTIEGASKSLARKTWDCARVLVGHHEASEAADTLEGVALVARGTALKRCARKRSKSARRKCVRQVRARYAWS